MAKKSESVDGLAGKDNMLFLGSEEHPVRLTWETIVGKAHYLQPSAEY
jgi:hypothetical protein